MIKNILLEKKRENKFKAFSYQYLQLPLAFTFIIEILKTYTLIRGSEVDRGKERTNVDCQVSL